MATNGESRPAVRFGSFEMDFRRGELRRDGHRVKLQGQPFHVLSMLLQQPGEVVTREELRNQIWPQDTFVDFDTGLYTAVKKLRLALNDTAGHPRFIETVARRGYRFLMEVEPAESAIGNHHSAFSSVTSASGSSSAELPGTTTVTPVEGVAPLVRKRRTMLLTAAVATAFLIVLVYFGWWLRSRPPRTNMASLSSGWKMSRLTTLGNCYDAVISPNGDFVAYVQDAGGVQSLWLRQIATASDSRLVAPGQARYWGLTFSPDGAYIYYVASRPAAIAGTRQDAALYRIALIGGLGVKLKEKLDSPVSFSPDGRQYAFVREDSSRHESVLMVAGVDGDAERKLASSQLPDYFDFPSWSPDGKTIACAGASFRSPSRIVFYAADGSGERHPPVSAPDWGHIRKIEWLRDGTGLLMAMKNRQAADYQLWRLSYPAGEMRRVTNDLNSYVRLSATADSHALLTIEETTAANIWVARNGNTAREVASDTGHYSGLSWTPDGRIVYAAETPGDSNIWIMDADGKNRKQLTRGNRFYHHPVVSPDGRYLFFNACQDDDCDIWRTDRDGAHPWLLTHGSHVRDLHCTPDGRWIVYTSPGSGQWSTLWRVPVDGGNPVQLSKNLAPWAAISPDGRWIACFYLGFQSDTQTGQPVLAIIPSQGGLPRRTFAVSATVNFLAGLQWTFDGKAVAYIDDRGGTSNIWSQPVTGGQPTPVTDFKGDKLFEFAWSNDGSRLVYLRGIDYSDIVLVTNFGSGN